MARENNGDARTQERRGVERAESAITQSPSNASPFLRELDSITGPNSAPGSGARAVDKLDKDGFTGRAEALEATKIIGETKNWLQRTVGTSLSRTDIQDYSQRPNLSDGERALSQRLLKDFNKISSDGQNITSSDITNFSSREKQHGDLRNLYAKDAHTGRSLYDSVKDDHGGISGDKLTKRLADPSLSNQDRASLDAVNRLRSGSGDVSSGAMQRANDAAGLTSQERQGSIRRSEPLSADAQAGQAALSDLTAKPNGGRSLLDRVGDGQGGISLDKVNALSKNPERNNLTERNVETLKYLQNHAPFTTDVEGGMHSQDYSKADLQKLAADAGQNWDRVSSRPERTKLDDVSRGRQEDFAHLFEKRNGNPSLYERLKSEDGGLSSARIDQELRNPALAANDRHTLDYIKSLAKDGWFSKKDIPATELAGKAHEHNISDRDLKRGGLDVTPAVEHSIKHPVEHAVPKPGVNNGGSDLPASVHGALKVRAGEGYWHSAERLIAEAHKGQRYDPTQAELSSVVKQLKAANGNRRELRQNEELVIDQSIRTNPALAGLFK